ncbi:hypothetical protein ACFFMN_23095 [Planobispora siamensis]|uniref:hypothetical protein n=1 Tax=Planobispora siamensis TaxID=936338 RepID=UPI00194EF8CF|nr:hypothetical protein [Planobispora siamensis]
MAADTRSEELLKRRTETAHAIAAEDIRAYTATVAARALDPDLDVTEMIDAAREMAARDRRFRVLTVLRARICTGASWDQIGALLTIDADTAKALYADAEQRWRDGDPAPWAPPAEDPAGTHPRRPVAAPIHLPPETLNDLVERLDVERLADLAVQVLTRARRDPDVPP